MVSCFFVSTAPAEDEVGSMSPAVASNIVTRAYQQELHREPDPAGMATFVTHLLEGKNETWLRNVLRQSPEAKAQRQEKRQRAMRLYVVPLCFILSGLLWSYGAERLRRFKLYIAILLALLFVLAYFALIMRYGINIPYWDDFDAILNSVRVSPMHRLRALLAQHNEHRIAVTRLVAEGMFYLRGHIDFKYFALIGNCFLAGTFCLFAGQLKKHPLCLPVLACLVFAPVAWSNMIWSMAAVQNNGVHFFALASMMAFFSATSRPLKTVFLFLLGTCATFTSGSGIFLFPALLFTLMGQRLTMHRLNTDSNLSVNLSDLAIVALLLIFVSAVYFANYTHPPGHPSTTIVLASPLQALNYFLSFAGSFVVSAGGTQFLSLLVGGILIAGFVMLTLCGAHTKSPALFSFALYLLITGLAATVTRMGFGISQALSDRYRINSLLLLGSLFVMTVRLLPRESLRRHFSAVFFACVLLLYVYSWTWAVSEMTAHRKVLITETAKWFSFGRGLYYPREGMNHAGAIMDEAIAKEVWMPPAAVSDAIQAYEQVPAK